MGIYNRLFMVFQKTHFKHTIPGIRFNPDSTSHSPSEHVTLKTWHFFWSLILSILIQVFYLSPNAWAQTEVEGEVSGVWDADGSPYVIVDTTFVPQDETLEIQPGVEVVFEQSMILTVLGEFHADGEEDDNIHFRRPDGNGPNCLIFEETSENSNITYCRLDTISVAVIGCSPVISNNHFVESRISYDGGGVAQISGNVFNAPVRLPDSVINIDGGNGHRIISNSINDDRNISIIQATNIFINETFMYSEEEEPGGTIRLRNVADLEMVNSTCWHLTISNARDITFNNCTISDLFQVLSVEGFVIQRGNYPTLRGDHLTEAVIDSCVFTGAIAFEAFEMTVTNSQMNSMWAGDWAILNVENCEIRYLCNLQASNDIEIEFRNNVINYMRVYCPNTLVENNVITQLRTGGQARLDIGPNHTTIFRNNRILNSITCGTSGGIDSSFFYHNDIGMWNNDGAIGALVEIRGTETARPLFVNNTFHEQENSRVGRWLVRVISTGTGGGTFYNNLFLGDAHGSKGLNVLYEDRGQITSDYNLFWGFDSLTNRCEIGEHSIVADPRVMSRRERDVHLLADSPLIDAGSDHWDESDLDETAPDIGCYYFDQSVDHPPFIVGELAVEGDPFRDFVYDAEVVDDGEVMEIWFENLPEWLEVTDDGDGHDETVRLSGRPPQDDAELYNFEIWSRDNDDQTDSIMVALTVNPNHRLWGEISGRLPRDGSPYTVVSTLTVPRGEELIIEPGTELRFRHYDDIPADARIEVLGSLKAIGTIEDSIIFTSESERGGIGGQAARDWHGIHIKADENQDSTIIQFCLVLHSRFGVECNAAHNVRISNCKLIDNYYSTIIYGGASVIVSDNFFDCSSLSRHMTGLQVGNAEGVFADSSFVVISGNEFQGPIDDDTLWSNNGMFLRSDSCEVFGNIFKNLVTAIGTGFAGPKLHKNVITMCLQGIWAFNESYPLVYNNDFIGLNTGCYFHPYDDSVGIKLFNNIFFQCDSVAIMSREYPWDESGGFEIMHNLLFGNSTDFYAMDIEGNPLPLNGLGEIVDTNANGDSCDTYYNIFFDPLIVAPDSGDYHLAENSPCINAGVDVGLPFGGHAPDIGAFEFDLINLINEGTLQPDKLTLFPNYPNPFNSQTRIRFSLPQRSETKLIVYDIQGRLQKVLVDDHFDSGQHAVMLNAGTLASGVYFVRLETKRETRINLIHLLK